MEHKVFAPPLKQKERRRHLFNGRKVIIMKLYEFRETDAFGDSYSYYIHAENEEVAKEKALEKGLTIEQLVEIKEVSEDYN
jgi:hypothetical protein